MFSEDTVQRSAGGDVWLEADEFVAGKRHVGIAVLVATSFPGPRTAVLIAAYVVASAAVSIPPTCSGDGGGREPATRGHPARSARSDSIALAAISLEAGWLS